MTLRKIWNYKPGKRGSLIIDVTFLAFWTLVLIYVYRLLMNRTLELPYEQIVVLSEAFDSSPDGLSYIFLGFTSLFASSIPATLLVARLFGFKLSFFKNKG